MDSKFALVVVCNSAYLPGLNAMLNALDYYDNCNLDVHIVFDKDISDYIQLIKDRFCFNVISYPLEGLFEHGNSSYYNYIWSKYLYVYKYVLPYSGYKAMCFLDADCLVVNNLMDQFYITSRVDRIFLPSWTFTPIAKEDLLNAKTPQEVDHCLVMLPLGNHPFFFNPEMFGFLVKDIYDSRPNEFTNADRERNHEMYFVNKIIYDLRCLPAVITLPGHTWVGDGSLGSTGYIPRTNAGKKYLYNACGDRCNIIHNKFWKEGQAAGELERARYCSKEIAELISSNIASIQQMLDLFNNNWRVKLNEV
jgi:hypothetical protein